MTFNDPNDKFCTHHIEELIRNFLPCQANSGLAQLINAACGYDWDVANLMQAGARGWNLKRAINCRLGLNARNDRLPKAMLEPLPSGGTGGFTPDLQGMLYSYYEARGWDQLTGFPGWGILNDLSLHDIAVDLWGKDV